MKLNVSLRSFRCPLYRPSPLPYYSTDRKSFSHRAQKNHVWSNFNPSTLISLLNSKPKKDIIWYLKNIHPIDIKIIIIKILCGNEEVRHFHLLFPPPRCNLIDISNDILFMYVQRHFLYLLNKIANFYCQWIELSLNFFFMCMFDEVEGMWRLEINVFYFNKLPEKKWNFTCQNGYNCVTFENLITLLSWENG